MQALTLVAERKAVLWIETFVCAGALGNCRCTMVSAKTIGKTVPPVTATGSQG